MFVQRRTFQEVTADWNAITQRFAELSEQHTPLLGCRTLDILHVAFAMKLHCEAFITCDLRQASLVKAAGIKLIAVTL